MVSQKLRESSKTLTQAQPLVIRAVSARTCFGREIQPILKALDAPRGFESSESVPIVDFVIKDEIGSRAIRNLDRAAGLAISAVNKLLEDAPGEVQTENTALIMGTSMGSVSSTIRFTQDGLSHARPYLVNPAEFPNTVMNFAAGQIAIRHQLTGPNATIIAGSVTGLGLLRYASRMIRGGQAENVIIVASEELTSERRKIHDAGPESPSGAGEGSAALLLGPATDDSHASVETLAQGVVTGFGDKDLPYESRWNFLVTAALGLTNIGDPPEFVIISGHDPSVDTVLGAVGRLTGNVPDVIDIRPVLGHTGAAAMALALAVCSEMLKQVQRTAATGWVLAVDRTGYAGIAVLEGSGVCARGGVVDG